MPDQIALVIAGAAAALDEYRACLQVLPGVRAATFVVNDMIAEFPDRVDHAVTLHPTKLARWLKQREDSGLSPVGRTWAHQSTESSKKLFPAVSDELAGYWRCLSGYLSGSSGFFALQIALVLGFRKIVLCGVPMTKEAGHFKRQREWDEALGFRAAWRPRINELRPFVRSMSGWTLEQFGFPDAAWLNAAAPEFVPTAVTQSGTPRPVRRMQGRPRRPALKIAAARSSAARPAPRAAVRPPPIRRAMLAEIARNLGPIR